MYSPVFLRQLGLCGRLVVSGISNSWLLIGSIYALFTTPYGQLLLFKLALSPSSLVWAYATGSSSKQSCQRLPQTPTCWLNFFGMCSVKLILASQSW